MKTKKIYSIIFIAILFSSCFGQDAAPSPVSYEQISKTLVKDLNVTINDYLVEDKVAEAAMHIKSKMFDCLELEDGRKLCEAGLNFTSGYLYQQAALKNGLKSNSYIKRAITYYEKVLYAYPDNKAAWSNFMKLMTQQQGIDPATIAKLEEMAKKYPSERVNIYVRIGDVYRNDNDLQKACSYYQKAYKEDPFSEKACGAMVELYTKYDFSCVMRNDIRQLAMDCQEIDLPNYSEELLRKELLSFFKNKKYTKALESLVLWAYVMADNDWLTSSKVTRLKTNLFPKSVNPNRSGATVYQAIQELQIIVRSEQIENIDAVQFWKGYNPSVNMYDNWGRVLPKSVLYKILYSKGKKKSFQGNPERAEKFWQYVLDKTRDDDRAFFTVVASEMAELYYNNPSLDPSDKKLNKLIIRLFNMKGAAYGANDLRMIRKYHITLGGIFYNKKKWEGDGAANARFQLSRAVSSRFGPIVNPRLRRMLGDVYTELDQNEDAVNAYTKSIEDYLSLDLIRDADRLITIIVERYSTSMNATQSKKLNSLRVLIGWRKEFKNPDNDILKNKMSTNDYLKKVSIAQVEANKSLSKEFVKLQFFKGLSDLGASISDDRKIDKQIIFANALGKIDKIYELSSPTDFNRIKKIKISLEESVEQPKKLEKAKMNKRTDLSYTTSGSKAGFRTYTVNTLNKEVIVPTQLFELNKVLKNHYATDKTLQKAEIEYRNGRPRVKN